MLQFLHGVNTRQYVQHEHLIIYFFQEEKQANLAKVQVSDNDVYFQNSVNKSKDKKVKLPLCLWRHTGEWMYRSMFS
jgi:hypothetical protein